MNRDLNAAPLNPLPPVVWALVLPMVAMEAVFAIGAQGLAGGPGAVGWRLDAVQRFAFAPEYLRQMYAQNLWPLDGLMRLVTYPFVHVNFTHALFVVVILLAMGKMVGEVFRWWALLVIFFASAIAGRWPIPWSRVCRRRFWAATRPSTPDWGVHLPALGQPGSGRREPVSRLHADRFLLGIQLLFGLLFGGGWEWVADLSGFVTGFLLSFVVSPGGWARVRAKLRQR